MGEFGKDDKVLADIPVVQGTFQQATSISMQDGRQSERANRRTRYWEERFKVPSGSVNAATIRIVPGDYQVLKSSKDGSLLYHKMPYVEACEHKFNNRTALCSGGPYRLIESHCDMREPCHGCDLHWEERWEKRGQGLPEWKDVRMGVRDIYGFTVAVLGPVHKVQARYVTGERKGLGKTDRNDKPIMEWVTCRLQGCEGCRTGAETVDGIKLPWVIGPGHLRTIQEWSSFISQDCTNCGTTKGITADTWACKNCGRTVIDIKSTGNDEDRVKALIRATHTCPDCGHQDLLKETLSCRGCDTPVRAQIWDVDIEVYTQKSENGNLTTLGNTRISRPGNVDPKYTLLVMEPLDLEALLAPDDMAYQEAIWKLKSTAQAPPASELTKEYNRG